MVLAPFSSSKGQVLRPFVKQCWALLPPCSWSAGSCLARCIFAQGQDSYFGTVWPCFLLLRGCFAFPSRRLSVPPSAGWEGDFNTSQVFTFLWLFLKPEVNLLSED